jgi:ornithine cyclodeaminase
MSSHWCAVSALTPRLLARASHRVMALIGNGAQTKFQPLAFHSILAIDTVRLVDTGPAASARLLANLNGNGLKVEVGNCTRETVCGAGIVTTFTDEKQCANIAIRDLLKPGMYIKAGGVDCPGQAESEVAVLHVVKVFSNSSRNRKLGSSSSKYRPTSV